MFVSFNEQFLNVSLFTRTSQIRSGCDRNFSLFMWFALRYDPMNVWVWALSSSLNASMCDDCLHCYRTVLFWFLHWTKIKWHLELLFIRMLVESTKPSQTMQETENTRQNRKREKGRERARRVMKHRVQFIRRICLLFSRIQCISTN